MPEMERMVIPAFLSETEEAVWWDSHQDLIAQRFLQAAAAGTLGHGRAVRQAEVLTMPNSVPTMPLQVAEDDISRARALASRKGLGYQAYLQTLIHEALEREEQRVA